MKTQTPFWPLLKNELALGRSGGTGNVAGILLAYWLLVGAVPLMVLFGDNDSRGNIASVFDAGSLPILAFPFLSSLTLWITYATVPAFCDILSPAGVIPGALQNLGAFEFLFTRAVDRGMLFRARATAFFIVALTPLFLNVAVSPFAPDITFSPATSTPAELIRRQGQYLRAFPASHRGTSHAMIVPGQVVIPHGAVAYTAWLAWNGTLAFLLLQGYGSWIARRVKPNRWWTASFPGAPIFFLLLTLILVAKGSRRTHINIYENSFLFFSTHPLAMVIALAAVAAGIQCWCERRFSKLEIL
jgi:hypothetical protein